MGDKMGFEQTDNVPLSLQTIGDCDDESGGARLYVNWSRIEDLVAASDIDLSEYGGSALHYLAARLGQTWQSMRRIHLTGSTTLQTISRIADVLGVDPREILDVEK